MPPRPMLTPALLGVGLLILGWIFLLLTGVGAGAASLLSVVIGIQVWAGSYLWAVVRRGTASTVETLGVGMALGTIASTLSGLLVLIVTGTNAGWLAPAVAAVVVALIRWRRRTMMPTRGSRGGSETQKSIRNITKAAWLGLLAMVVLGLASLIPNVLSYPLTWTGMWSRYHADMLFFESLSTSMARLGPLDSIFTPDALIRYHWLVYAWTGQVSAAVDSAPFVALTRVLPLVAVIGSCLIGIAWVSRMTRAVWAPALVVVLLVSGGYVGAAYGAVFNFDSPSQSMTTLWLLALAFIVGSLVGRRKGDAGDLTARLIVVGLLAFGLAGGKISAGAVGLAAVLWLAAVGLAGRAPWRREAALHAVVVLAAFTAGYLLVVAGSADPGGLRLFDLLDRGSSVQGLNPVPGATGIVLGTGILAIAIAGRWSGMLWFLVNRPSRWQPETQLGLGFALAALVTIVALSGGLNDTWFALAASAPLSVLSAAGAGEAWQGLDRRRWVVLGAALVAAVVAFAVVWVLWTTGASGGNTWVSTWRWAAPLAGIGTAAVIGAAAAGILRPGGRAMLTGAVLATVALAATGRLLGVGTGQVGVQPGLSEDAFSAITSFTETRDRTDVTAWSDRQQAAAQWLREESGQGDLVASNVTLSPLVPALTARQTLASGIRYQAPYGRPGDQEELLAREAASWAFVDEPSEITAAPLCEAGVWWLWVDPNRTKTRDWEPFAQVAFANEEVVILRLDEATCG